jgi:hypothetical protein
MKNYKGILTEEELIEQNEIQKEQHLVERAEKETFQELNGFSVEENEFINQEYGVKVNE